MSMPFNSPFRKMPFDLDPLNPYDVSYITPLSSCQRKLFTPFVQKVAHFPEWSTETFASYALRIFEDALANRGEYEEIDVVDEMYDEYVLDSKLLLAANIAHGGFISFRAEDRIDEDSLMEMLRRLGWWAVKNNVPAEMFKVHMLLGLGMMILKKPPSMGFRVNPGEFLITKGIVDEE